MGLASTNTSLSLHILGALRVYAGDTILKFRSRKELALLLYLVMEREPHEREKLAVLLWPESDTTKARTALRNTLARLRKSLAPAGDYIMTEGTQISFDDEKPYTLDVESIEQITSHLTPSCPQSQRETALDLLKKEVAEGFNVAKASDFEDWLLTRRESWKLHRETLLGRYCQQCLEAHEPRAAVQSAQHWAACAPLSERAHRHLMQAHALAGDKLSAMKAFRQYEERLDTELGLTPSTALTALAKQIQTDGLLFPDTIQSKQTQTLATLQIPFVGRAKEQQQLVNHYHQVLKGKPVCFFITGLAGYGKTKIVESFSSWLHIQPHIPGILRGEAYELVPQLPYQPIVDAIRAALAAINAPEDLLSDIWLAELSQILPELRERYPDLSLPLTGGNELQKSRMFESIALFTHNLSIERPLVFIIEDVQWCDRGSLELLLYLATRWIAMGSAVLLLLTSRIEPTRENEALETWLTTIQRVIPTHVEKIEALRQGDVHRLLQEATHTPHHTEDHLSNFSEWLFKETDGVPFALVETLYMLLEEKILGYQGNAIVLDPAQALTSINNNSEKLIPETIRNVILSRYQRLNEQARALLMACAVLGKPSHYEHICEIAGMSELDGLQILDLLLKSHLLVEHSPQATYACSHDNIRETIYREVAGANRVVYHKRAYSVLQDKASSAELAFHSLRAGKHANALQHYLTAADQAGTLYAVEESLTHYDKALALAKEFKLEMDSETTRDLYINRGHMFELVSQMTKAMNNYEELKALAEARIDPQLELSSLIAMGLLMQLPSPYLAQKKGHALLERGLELARQFGNTRAEVLALRGIIKNRITTFQPLQGSIDLATKAMQLSKELGWKAQIAYTTEDMMQLHLRRGSLQLAKNYAIETERLCRQLGNITMLSTTLRQHAHICFHICEFQEALQLSEEALEATFTSQNTWWEPVVHGEAAHIHWGLGEYKEAVKRLNEASDSIKRHNQPPVFLHLINYWHLFFAIDLDELETAESLLASLATAPPKHPFLMISLAHMIELMRVWYLIKIDQRSEALAAFSALPAEIKEVTLISTSIYELPLCLAHIISELGTHKEAIAAADNLLTLRESKEWQLAVADGYVLKGQAYLKNKEHKKAHEFLQKAHEEAQRHNVNRLLPRIEHLMAQSDGLTR